MQKLKPPLKWHGGKHYLAARIVSLMPSHVHYVEPYFGGGSVLLHKDPAGISEVVNDIYRPLTNFWSVLKDEPSFRRFRRLAEATPFCEHEWEQAADFQPRHPQDVEAAFRFFVRCRQSRAGQFADFATISRNRTRRNMNEQASAWMACVDGLPAVAARLRRVVILNRDARDVIESQNGAKTLFYVDPPYLPQTRTSADVYAHEMTDREHAALLATLQSVNGRAMVSGYRSPLYDRALANWNRHEFELPNNAAGGKAKRRMTECVWCNF